MDFDIEEFKKDLKRLTKDTFEKCKKKINLKEISGFGLYSDNSAMTISISLNTYEHLKEMQEDEPGYDLYFKWSMGEWKYEMINLKEFEDLNELLQVSHDQLGQYNFLKHRDSIYNCAVGVLEELRREAVFRRVADDFVLMFGVSDFSEPELEIDWVKKLNSKDKSKEFIEYIESEED